MRSFDDFFCSLVVVPEEVDSYECVNILNYHSFGFQVEEDNYLKQTILKEMGFPKDSSYPCLIIESTSELIPSADVAGSHQVLQFLHREGFIGDFKSHSAKETQAMAEFVQGQAEPLFWELTRPLKTKLKFYSIPRHFDQVKVQWEVSDFAKLYYWKFRRALSQYKADKRADERFEGGPLARKEVY